MNLRFVRSALVAASFSAVVPAHAEDPPAVGRFLGNLRQCWDADTRAFKAAPRPDYQPAHQADRIPDNDYPFGPLDHGHQGSLKAGMLVDALGNIRFAHVIAQAMSGDYREFRANVLRLLRRARFQPATYDDVAVPTWVERRITYALTEATKGGDFWKIGALKELRTKADAGDVDSMATVSYLDYIGAPVLKPTDADSDARWRFLAYAALGGEPLAVMRSTRVFVDAGCVPDAGLQNSLDALVQSGNPRAVLNLAAQLLEQDDAAHAAQVSSLLHVAAQSQDGFSRTVASGVLATHPDPRIRDAPFALMQARTLDTTDDPDALEALAAAQAANGQFDDALKSESAALALATRWKWQTARMQERLAKYQAKSPWEGLLCDCRRISPWSGLVVVRAHGPS